MPRLCNESAPIARARHRPGALRASVAEVPRILRTTLPDGYFHVYMRGVADTRVFADDEDRRTFLDLLLFVRRRYGWTLHTFCLMTTHYHFVLESACAGISAG